MYGKIFTSIYDGTLRLDWKALITFQQMIVLCDIDGVVDMTTVAIHARTGIPLDIIEAGIEFLERPDPRSRTDTQDGCRIQRIDPEKRDWGWIIVNYQKYRNLRDKETIRAQTKERVRRHREKIGNANVTLDNEPKRQEEEEEEEEVTTVCNKRVEGLDSEAWSAWIAYRKDIKRPLKRASLEAAAKRLAAHGTNQKAVVEQSIANGWQGLFALKNETHKRTDNSAPARVRRAYGIRR